LVITPSWVAAIQIIVPARNEAGRLPQGLAALCQKAATLPMRAEILVVDNASTDSTADIVRSRPAGPVPVRLLHCQRVGKGAAVRTGLLATTAPFAGFCDADMATDLAAFDIALPLLEAGHPAVIGSRALAESVVEHRHSATRRAGAVAFRTLARRIVPDVSDTQCGFKFFDGRLARAAALSLRTAGFAFDIELIAGCLRLGATITEIPVRWRDVPGSTSRVSRQSVQVGREVAAIWLRTRHAVGRTGIVSGPVPRLLAPAPDTLAAMQVPEVV
jgi:glycosyltransferase involved in cell wall biosynthesis